VIRLFTPLSFEEIQLVCDALDKLAAALERKGQSDHLNAAERREAAIVRDLAERIRSLAP
jgi:hypothetical protein